MPARSPYDTVQPDLRPPPPPLKLPVGFSLTCQRLAVRPTHFVLVVTIGAQSLWLFEKAIHQRQGNRFPNYHLHRRFLCSTSRFGIGQRANSDRTPLGLHRIVQKIGGGWPVGTVFRSRQPVGYTWQGLPAAPITSRILWLDGLEPGFNRGGNVDTRNRYIYIHGTGNESTLGDPVSDGCIHLAAADLLPLFDQLITGTLVWIAV